MSESDDRLIDTIRRAIEEVRIVRPTNPTVMLPVGWLDLNDVERLIPIAAHRFEVPEDDVTFAMLFTVAATDGALKAYPTSPEAPP